MLVSSTIVKTEFDPFLNSGPVVPKSVRLIRLACSGIHWEGLRGGDPGLSLIPLTISINFISLM